MLKKLSVLLLGFVLSAPAFSYIVVSRPGYWDHRVVVVRERPGLYRHVVYVHPRYYYRYPRYGFTFRRW